MHFPTDTTHKLNTNHLQPPKQSPTLSHLVSSASPSPTSSTSSYQSYFDTRIGKSPFSGGERRESACSNTSWGSMGETPSSKPPDQEDILMADDEKPDHSVAEQTFRLTQPLTSGVPSNESIDSISTSQSSSSTSSGPKIYTPEYASSPDRQSPFHTAHNGQPQTSPSSSTTSKATSKDDYTPKAELSAPFWPHASSSSPIRKTEYEMPHIDTRDQEQHVSTARKPSLKRTGSWRRKHAR